MSKRIYRIQGTNKDGKIETYYYRTKTKRLAKLLRDMNRKYKERVQQLDNVSVKLVDKFDNEI